MSANNDSWSRVVFETLHRTFESFSRGCRAAEGFVLVRIKFVSFFL